MKPPQTMKVYRYGLRPPTVNQDIVYDQLYKAHRYRNTLIEIERDRRQRVRAALVAHPTVEPLKQQLDRLTDEIAVAKAADDAVTRKRLQKQRKQVRIDLKAAKEALYADDKTMVAIQTIHDAAHTAYKRARAESGVFWGTYLLVEQAHEASRKGKADPHFVAYNGRGQLGVQIQKGMSTGKLVDDNRLRIVPVEDRKGRHRFAELHMRIQSDEKRQPVWGVWPMRVHRFIHPDARIKKAAVTVKREGTRSIWQVEITVEEPAVKAKSGTRAIAIDLGWRSAGVLRTAKWLDTEGNRGEVTVPLRVQTGLQKAATLRSIRDGYLNVLRYVMGQWFVDHPPPAGSTLDDARAHLAKWRSPKRFVRLWRTWRDHRYDGDDYGFSLIDAWRRRDRHLYDWEAAQRRKSCGRRNQVYADFAAQIGRIYDHVIIEGPFDLRTWARRVPGEEKADGYARKNRVVAAPGLLRSAIERSWASRGFRLHDIEPAYTTRDCHVCDHREAWDQKRELVHTCGQCGATWDQDDNAADNLLTRWKHEGGPRRNSRPRAIVKKGGRWKKRKDDKAAAKKAPKVQKAVG